MSLRINTNVAALNAYNNLSTNQGNLEGAFAKLSSGLRINKAADDAAGLSIAQGLTSQINGLTQAVSNANDGINVAQIADGALGTTQDILQRMRTLVVKAANVGTQDPSSLGAIQKEIGNLNTQLDNIASQTKFGQTNLLDGNYNKNFQVGANGGDTIRLNLTNANVNSTNLSTDTLGIAKGVVDAELTTAQVTTLNGTGAGSIAGATDSDGTDSTNTVSQVLNASSATANDGSLAGALAGAGLSGTAYGLVSDGNGGFNIQGTTTSNVDGTTVATLTKTGNVWTVTNSATGATASMGTADLAAGEVNTMTTYLSTDATADLATLNAAIGTVSDARSQIGAVQNQLNYTVDNLQTAITNVTASRSNLMDADLATQVTKMSQSQILMQASTSVLAQANSAPQAILKLLQ